MYTLRRWIRHYPRASFTAVFVLLTLVYSLVHCFLYFRVYSQDPISFVESSIWAVKKFGFWWLATPFLLGLLPAVWKQNKILAALLMVGSLVASMVASLALDTLHLGTDPLQLSGLLFFLPAQLVSCAYILFAAAMLNVIASPAAAHSSLAQADQQAEQPTLDVQLGTRNLALAINKIDSISADGNYMEVYDGERQYLIRATMRQLEQQLQPYGFVRIHRSHLVRRAAVKLARSKEAVVLRCGKALPLGQKYRKNI